ncbi:uncharacterized protein TNCV_847101 [Trichonephila clavipes]|nr:uncharacterized protein TNCV_847101 [Trichonephila clavipes]
MTGTLPPLLDSVVGGGTPGRSFLRVFMDPNMLCPGKGLVLPTLTVDQIAAQSRFLLISLPNKEMSNKSPFAIHNAMLGIGGEPKSIKRLRSGDLLIETISDLQTKSFLLAKTFLNSPVNCPKWKAEKEIQAIKTNRNISYLEARKLIAPQLSQTYAQVAKPSTVTSTTQTDENITQIKCPPLQLLQPLLSVPQPDKSNSVSLLSSATQADILPSTSSIAATISEPPHLIPVSDTLLSTTSNMFTPIEPSSSIISASISNPLLHLQHRI